MTSPLSNHSALSVAQLRQEFSEVIGPGDAEYDSARRVFNLKFDRRPAVVIRPANTSEVARVVSLARETGRALAVRGSGHSAAGHSVCDDGIVLDLARLRDIDVDVGRRTAWAQPGMTAGEYTSTAGAHGLATGFGDVGSVGIGGLTVGGGVGYLSRKYGLTIDSLLAAEVVTADGRVRHVDDANDPELFWAIRGGGGNFGVVTRFRFRLQEVSTVTAGMLMLPATPETIASFVAEAQAAPDELSTVANVMVAPPMPFVPAEYHGRVVIGAMLCHCGATDEGERVIAPFRALATPIADLVRPMPYPELYQFGPEIAPERDATRTLFLDAVGRDRGEVIVNHLTASTATTAMAQLRVLGGAVARVPDEATAYAHRGRRVMVYLAAMFENASDVPVHEAWVSGISAALNPPDSAWYVNFMGDKGGNGATQVRDAYPGATWDRLVMAKRRDDPTNLFRLNHNIPPGG